MTAKSMTGYGKLITSNELCDLKIEMKSVNSRYFDCNIRMPKLFNFIEINLKNTVKEILVRGKVDVYVDLKLKQQQFKPVLREEAVASYMAVFEELKSKFGIEGEVKLEHVLNFNDILESEEADDMGDQLGKFVIAAMKDCANSLDDMRAKEGVNLADDMLVRLGTLTEISKEIDENRHGVFEHWKERFIKRINEMGVDDEERIVQEAAVMSEKADIQEEITRIESHIEQFAKILNEEDANGKKLDFMCQELNREFNTIGSKSGKTGIINNVVQAKSEIEKIREQVQNLV